MQRGTLLLRNVLAHPPRAPSLLRDESVVSQSREGQRHAPHDDLFVMMNGQGVRLTSAEPVR